MFFIQAYHFVLLCHRLLREKSFNVFHYPVTEEEAPDYHTIIQTPMDVSTLLQRTDNGQYLTRSAFMQDLELIPFNAKVGLEILAGAQ